MLSYIIIHHTEQTFEMALFIDNTITDQRIEDKRLASKLLIPLLDDILKKNNLIITDISFFGINQGPGLFSTLRSIISTVNALHFSTLIPLIGIDGLVATALECSSTLYPCTITLLNAYNNEVYYAISQDKQIISTGYENITTFLDTLLNKSSVAQFYFVGNAVNTYTDQIKDRFGEQAIIPSPVSQLCSISTIACLALKKFTNNKKGDNYLSPLHLKKHPVEL